jgi:hypothetical protein
MQTAMSIDHSTDVSQVPEPDGPSDRHAASDSRSRSEHVAHVAGAQLEELLCWFPAALTFHLCERRAHGGRLALFAHTDLRARGIAAPPPRPRRCCREANAGG